ncbi:hypothetical protein ACFL3H_08670 [Gemmatimonadota bacterium]
MKKPSRIAVIRLFAVTLAISSLYGCEESLPPYVMPDAFFQVQIIASDLVVDPAEGIVPDGIEFAVDVTNILDPQNQFILLPPFDLEISISIFIESEPNRKRMVESHEQIDKILEPGETIRLFLPFPMTDDSGHSWSWDVGMSSRQKFLVLIGIVHIPQVGSNGIDIPTDRKKIRFFNLLSS